MIELFEVNDGLMLFFLRNNSLHQVLLNEEQYKRLLEVVNLYVLKGEIMRVNIEPLCEVELQDGEEYNKCVEN